jgi:4-hydroxy-2-oxoheptanedioate aldolase
MTEATGGPEMAFKEKLARGEIVYSMTVRLLRSVEIAPIAKAAGYDTIYIDLEHSSLSLETVSQISVASLGAGIAPFVRVPGLDAALIARILDGGAMGIIVPDVCSAAEVREIVRAARYQPAGDRSLLGLMPQLGYRSMPAADAMRLMNDATTVVVMIESPAGLEAVDEIAAVPGVDILLVGANDITTAHGVAGDYDHAVVEDAYRRTLEACRRHGKLLGIGGLASRPDLIRKYVELGGRYVSLGGDLPMLLGAAAQKRAEFA